MRKFLILSVGCLLVLMLASCTKAPLPFDPLNQLAENRWYVINEAAGKVQYVKLTDWSEYMDAIPAAYSELMSEMVIVGNYAYIAAGYMTSAGAQDIKKIDLASGLVVTSHYFGNNQNVAAGAFATDGTYIYATSYNGDYMSSAVDGSFTLLNTSLSVVRSVFIGGKPQSLAVHNGDTFIANISDYAYTTNWIDVIRSGQSSATRNPLSTKNPKGLAISADGKRLYVLCGGTFDMSYNPNNDGYVLSLTNLSGTLMLEKTISLGMNASGKIVVIDNVVYFTTGTGFYSVDFAGLTASQVSSVSGIGLNDVDVDSQYIYLTGGYGSTSCYVLKRSDLSLYKTLSLRGGQGALYLK